MNQPSINNENTDNAKSILDEVIISEQERNLQELDPSKLVFSLVKELPTRTESIIIRRFGLDGKGKRTLEEIGKSYGITRERVRQIESASLSDLRSKEKLSVLTPVEEQLESILNEHGRVMHSKQLKENFIGRLENASVNEHLIEFILELSDRFVRIDESITLHEAWSLPNFDLEIVHQTVNAFKELLENKGQPIHENEIINHIQEHQVYQEYQEMLNDKIISAYLYLSKHFKQNPFSEWGLREWSEIVPRGVKDKAYLVLKKHTKPLHFREITDTINKSGFEGRNACQQTVHNELIKDDRFVLIGRGIYALKEWGYQNGTVADVIEQLLQEKPLNRQEIIDGVFKQRMVKRNTVILALQDKNRFAKMGKDQFGLTGNK